MEEYLAIKGNTHYLANIDFDEAMCFDAFGNSQGSVTGKYAILNSISRTEIDILSVLGDQISGVCDVYFSGVSGTVSRSAFDVARGASKKMPLVSHRIYRVKRDDLSPGVRQLLIPIKKNSISISDLMLQLGVKSYSNVGG